eukprot:gb/GECG01009478.1/.p1 GENE.gb/GECG01009478.1/~~gb/GECG01009478.1/.p1  ORF type:complete len:762 (+),score=123.28 gb/GECG01009478.1/:1-2286(+)
MRNTRDDEKTSSPRNTGSLVSVLEAMKQALWANKDPRKIGAYKSLSAEEKKELKEELRRTTLYRISSCTSSSVSVNDSAAEPIHEENDNQWKSNRDSQSSDEGDTPVQFPGVMMVGESNNQEESDEPPSLFSVPPDFLDSQPIPYAPNGSSGMTSNYTNSHAPSDHVAGQEPMPIEFDVSNGAGNGENSAPLLPSAPAGLGLSLSSTKHSRNEMESTTKRSLFESHMTSILHRTAAHHRRGFRDNFGSSVVTRNLPTKPSEGERHRKPLKDKRKQDTQSNATENERSVEKNPKKGKSHLFHSPNVPVKLSEQHAELATLGADEGEDNSDSGDERDFLKVITNKPGSRTTRKGEPRRKRARKYYLNDEVLEPSYFTHLEEQDGINPDIKNLARGTFFLPEIRSMMHGFADTCHPSYECARLLHDEITRWLHDMVIALRDVLGKTTIQMRDFLKIMPDQVRLYFRWKQMREMSKPESQVDSLKKDATGASGVPKSINGVDNEGDAGDEVEEDTDDDDEDLALVKAEASEISISDGSEVGNDATAIEHFKSRIAFANRRTKMMTSQQYLGYSRAREAHFLAYKELADKFKSCIPGSPMPKNTIRILGYLCYDRIGTITECANKIVHAGALTEPEESLPVNSYYAAINALPEMPTELARKIEYMRNQQQLISKKAIQDAEKPERVAAHNELLQEAGKEFQQKRRLFSGSGRLQDDSRIASTFKKLSKNVNDGTATKRSGDRLSGIKNSPSGAHISPAATKRKRPT